MISIRRESVDDHADVHRITVEAFANSELGYHGEAELIEKLRDVDGAVSIVACDDEAVVGHLLLTPVRIRFSDKEKAGMGLAPMSVVPARQHRGIGSRLVRHAVELVFAGDCPLLVVLGHGGYYKRFGFRAASKMGYSHGFAGIPQEVFFALANPRFSNFNEMSAATVWYRPEFGPQVDPNQDPQ